LSVALTVIVALAAALVVGASAAPASSSANVIKLRVAVVNDLSGPLSFYGNGEVNGAQLAAKEINAAPKMGVKIEILGPYDSQSTPDGTLSAVQRALGDNPDVVNGIAFTQNGQAAIPLLAQTNKPVLFTSVSQLGAGRTPNLYTLTGGYEPLMSLLVKKVLVDRKIRTIGVIWQQQPTLIAEAVALRSATKRAGIDIAADEGASLTATDFNSQVTNILNAKPQAVVVLGLAGPTASIVSQLRARGFTGLIAGQPGAANATFAKAAGNAAEGTVFPVWWDPAVANKRAQHFLKAYVSTYPSAPAPDFFALLGYDAIYTLAYAAKKAGKPEATAFLKALGRGTYPLGVNGKLRFRSGYPTLAPAIVQFKGGVTVRLTK
jgi:branched-chain amino acid transport system substrate-binding protein